MKTTLTSAAALIFTASMASASGPIAPQPPVMVAQLPATTSWTGLYAGASLGFGSANYDIDGTYDNPGIPLTASLNLPDLGAQGVLFGLQAGYNHQLSSTWVIGAQIDAMGSNITNDTALNVVSGPNSITGNYDLTVSSMYTVSGRLGYLTSPNTMVYGLLGVTRGNFTGDYNLAVNAVPLAAGSYDFSLNGMAVGVGMETMLNDHLSLGVEYRYNSMQRYTFYNGPLVGGDTLDVGFDTSVHTFRAMLNYRF